MMRCPYCGSENWPENEVCYACGTVLRPGAAPAPPAADAAPTQPVRAQARPARVSPAAGEPYPGRSPAPGDTHRGRPPEGTAPRQAYTPPYTPAPAASPSPGYARPVQPGVLPGHRDTARFWRIFAIVLGLVILCAGAFAVWTIGATAANGVRRWTAGIATQAAQIVPGSQPTETPAATEAAQIPTAWPTFTPEGAAPTPEPDWENYLTPECAAAVAHLRSANQVLSDNPAAPLDSAWRDDLSAAVSEMRTFCGSIESASPVPGLVGEAHRDLTLATEEYDTANRLFKEGIDEFKPGKLVESAQHLGEAAKYLGLAVDELNKIGK